MAFGECLGAEPTAICPLLNRGRWDLRPAYLQGSVQVCGVLNGTSYHKVTQASPRFGDADDDSSLEPVVALMDA